MLREAGQREGVKATVFLENVQCLPKSLCRQHLSLHPAAQSELAGNRDKSLSPWDPSSLHLQEVTCTAISI